MRRSAAVLLATALCATVASCSGTPILEREFGGIPSVYAVEGLGQAVADGRLYVTRDNTLVVLDAGSGEELWSVSMPDLLETPGHDPECGFGEIAGETTAYWCRFDDGTGAVVSLDVNGDPLGEVATEDGGSYSVIRAVGTGVFEDHETQGVLIEEGQPPRAVTLPAGPYAVQSGEIVPLNTDVNILQIGEHHAVELYHFGMDHNSRLLSLPDLGDLGDLPGRSPEDQTDVAVEASGRFAWNEFSYLIDMQEGTVLSAADALGVADDATANLPKVVTVSEDGLVLGWVSVADTPEFVFARNGQVITTLPAEDLALPNKFRTWLDGDRLLISYWSTRDYAASVQAYDLSGILPAG